MKKIAIYNGQLYMGGIERVLINYLSKLSTEEELDITLIIKENLPEKNVFKEDIPKNIKVEYIKSEEYCRKVDSVSNNKKNLYKRLKKQWYLFYNRVLIQRWVDKYFKKNKFDYIIDFDGSLIEYVRGVNIPCVGWIHYSLSRMKRKKYENKRKKFEKYSKVVAICDEMLEEYKNLYPSLKDKGKRIYNPMNYEEIRVKSEDIKLLTEDELQILNQDYFIAVSRLVAGKNLVSLVEIYSELKKRGVKEKLYILGDGEDRVNIEKKVKELGLEDDVLLLGQKKNPFPFIKRAKLFLHSSRGEGLGMVLVEAMTLGVVVVAYDCPTGPKEILMNGKAGGLVELDNKDKYVETVLEILNSSEKRAEIRKNMDLILKEFSYKEKIRGQIMALLEKSSN